MTKKDAERYEMLIRVRQFGVQHRQRFPEGSAAPAAFAAVAAEIDRLAALQITARNATDASRVDAKREAHRKLTEVLSRAGQAARVVARTSPELAAHVPPALPRRDHELVALGRQFAERAGLHAPEFATLGVPLPDLEARTTAFEQAMVRRGQGRQDRVQTRAEIDAAFTRAYHAVAILDLSVASCLANDPVALAVWRNGRRISNQRRNYGMGEVEPVEMTADPSASATPAATATPPLLTAPPPTAPPLAAPPLAAPTLLTMQGDTPVPPADSTPAPAVT